MITSVSITKGGSGASVQTGTSLRTLPDADSLVIHRGERGTSPIVISNSFSPLQI